MNRLSRLSGSKTIVAMVAGLTLQSCLPANVGMWLQVKRYKGDGVAENSSLFWWPGYRISFPEFDPRFYYQKQYHLNNVPQRGGVSAAFSLHFRPSLLSSEARPTGAYAFVLKEVDGTVMQSGVIRFSDALWSQTGMKIDSVYDRNKCYLDFKPKTKYILNVKYAPGPHPALTRGVFFCLENMGGK